MLRSLALFAVLASTGSAAFALEVTDLTGTWTIDQDAFWDEMTKSHAEFSQLPPDQVAMVKGMMLKQLGDVTWNFGADGASFHGMHGASKTAEKPKSWTSTGPKTATVVPNDEKSGPIALELKDDGKLVITAPSHDAKNGKVTLVFKRGAAKP
jgi:hypothetical protein